MGAVHDLIGFEIVPIDGGANIDDGTIIDERRLKTDQMLSSGCMFGLKNSPKET
jgi:hypothetical protein